MPRKGMIQFIASTSPNDPPAGLVIPDDIKREAEEVYWTLKTANGRMRVEYDTEAEASEFVKLTTAYCNTRPTDIEIIRNLFRPDGKGYEGDPDMVAKIVTGGPIKFRKSPVRGEKSDTIIQYRITDVQTENEKKTAEIREATEKVNETPAPEETPAEPAKPTQKPRTSRK